jgi:hypothetical protein
MRFLIRHVKLEESFADEVCGLVLPGRRSQANPMEVTIALRISSPNPLGCQNLPSKH